MEQHQQQQRRQSNRYAHLVTGSAAETVRQPTADKAPEGSKPPTLGQPGAYRSAYANNYYNSFSGLDWGQQWVLFKERIRERAAEPANQRKLILVIVCCALLLDNMLYMVIVPIVPDYLRKTGAWSTYTENATWIRRNNTQTEAGHRQLYRPTPHVAEPTANNKWVRISGTVVYEGEASAVGLLFASKAIVQLFINPFSGAIIDKIGYEVPMMIGLTVMFFSTMVFACGQTYSILFLARSLQGVGSAFADTGGLAMIADRFTEENERQRALGIALAFISFGCLVAPPFGAFLYQFAGKEVPFIILSLVCLLDGSLLLLVTPPGTFLSLVPGCGPARTGSDQVARPTAELEPAAKEPTERAPAEGQTEARKAALRRQKSISRRQSMTAASAGEAPQGTPIYVLFRDPYIACCAGALVTANVSLAFLEPTISIWMENTMADIEEWQMGMIWLPAFVPHVLGVYSTVRLADKYSSYQWLIAAVGLALEGASCLLVPFCTSFWSLIVPISVICFGLALIDTAILPMLGYLVDTRYVSVYGSIYAIADISYSLSYAVGPIIAGGIVEAIGFTALNFLIAVVTLGYTPALAMLRSIRDYQPFEAADSAPADLKLTLGRFGRGPLEVEEASGAPTDRPSPATTRYDSPKWARPALAKKSSMRAPETSAESTAKSVKIVEESRGRNPFLADDCRAAVELEVKEEEEEEEEEEDDDDEEEDDEEEDDDDDEDDY